MRYVRSDQANSPQLLQVEHGGGSWTLQLVHCTTNELSQGRAGATPHVHEVYHIVLFTRGNNAFWLGDRAMPSSPGLLVLCPPGVPHDFAPQRPEPVSYAEVTFEWVRGEDRLILPYGELLSLFASAPVAPLPLCKQLSPGPAGRIGDLLSHVVREATTASALSLFRAHAALMDLLIAIVDEVEPSPQRLDIVEQAHRNLLMRFAQPLAIGTLASELGVTAAYLSRAFRERYGMSPVQFRQELRLTAAARLLRTSSLSCKEVASKLGFADVQTFTKAFVRYHGQTPGRVGRR